MSQATTTRQRGTPAAGPQLGPGGKRLAAAFDAVSNLPALAEARRRLAAELARPGASDLEIASAVEADAGLAIAVMQAANNGSGPSGRSSSVPAAIADLGAQRIATITARIPTYDLLELAGSAERYERFRRHATAVRQAAERVADQIRMDARDELAVAALFHDVGRPVLATLYGEEHLRSLDRGETPDDRARAERRQLGIDHALVGSVLVRRWGVSATIASAIERHHSGDAGGIAAAVRLADMMVHHASGDQISVPAMRETAAALGIDDDGLRSLLFDFPQGGQARRRATEPCPLSARELDALRGLAEGKVYKQIAHELSLSVSTVRTHLHNVYRKIGAVDRAQAVLLARDRGWL